MAVLAIDANARAMVDLTVALNPLVVVEEGGCMSEVEVTSLATKLA